MGQTDLILLAGHFRLFGCPLCKGQYPLFWFFPAVLFSPDHPPPPALTICCRGQWSGCPWLERYFLILLFYNIFWRDWISSSHFSVFYLDKRTVSRFKSRQGATVGAFMLTLKSLCNTRPSFYSKLDKLFLCVFDLRLYMKLCGNSYMRSLQKLQHWSMIQNRCRRNPNIMKHFQWKQRTRTFMWSLVLLCLQLIMWMME